MRTYQSNGEPSTDTAPRDEFEAFEIALRTLSERVRTDDAFAHDLYGALCNMRWRLRDSGRDPVSMSWRHGRRRLIPRLQGRLLPRLLLLR
jgi:hypothetical protein